MLRRTFLGTAATAAASATASPASPAAGTGIRLGFDTYSIRAFKWKAIQLLDYAAGLKLDAIQLSSLGDYESLEPAYLQQVKDHAARVGIAIDAGMGCICPTSSTYNTKKDGDPAENILKGLRVAKAVGSSSMRCFLGSAAERPEIGRHIESTIKVFRAVRSRALDMGVKIALENHSGDLTARDVRTIIEESGKDAVGSCLDTGNPMWSAEHPLVTLETLAPYVLTTHFRDWTVCEHPRGALLQWVALGDGCIDFKRFVSVFRTACPNANIHLEIITGRKPEVLAYWEPEFWKLFPNMYAADFARFLMLAKNGHPFMGNMVMGGWKEPPVIEAALKEQQRVDLERSLEYAKKVLGVGIRWKG